MKLIWARCDCRDKKRFSLLLYRQMKRYCENPVSLLFPLYGGKGVKCSFSKARDLEDLHTRDHVEQMNEPFLARREEKGNFSRENCFFIDSKITVKQFINDVYGWESSRKE
jgi:hypothetical protein